MAAIKRAEAAQRYALDVTKRADIVLKAIRREARSITPHSGPRRSTVS